MVTSMMGCILMANPKGLEPTLGPMARSIRESLKMGCGLEMEFGSLVVKNMKGLILMIREMERECISGRGGAFIKGALLRI
jgi:hypothetical protein